MFFYACQFWSVGWMQLFALLLLLFSFQKWFSVHPLRYFSFAAVSACFGWFSNASLCFIDTVSSSLTNKMFSPTEKLSDYYMHKKGLKVFGYSTNRSTSVTLFNYLPVLRMSSSATQMCGCKVFYHLRYTVMMFRYAVPWQWVTLNNIPACGKDWNQNLFN